VSWRQVELGLEEPKPVYGHGGARPGAGRPKVPREQRSKNMPHVARQRHWKSCPAHMTMRGVRGIPNLRDQIVVKRIAGAIQQASKDGFRVVHFSVQSNHVHAMVEGDDHAALQCGAQGLAIRLAKAINRVTGRAGRVWAERHERRDLRTPTEVRNCLVYILFDFRKHARGPGRVWANRSLDPKSSAIWFDGWSARAGPHLATLTRETKLDHDAPCVAPPKRWLTRTGWRKFGLLEPNESPSDRSRSLHRD
jgi:putative transposase